MTNPLEDRPTLEELRTEIAQITKEMIRLAGRRTSIAREVGRIKDLKSIPTEDRIVEDALVKAVLAECDEAGLERATGLKILSALLAASKRAQGMEGRPTPGSILSKALALQRQGVKLIRFDVGEPDFHPPRAVLKACSDALFAFKTRYTEPSGIPELKSALRRYLARKFRYRAEDEQVVVTPSGRFAVFAALSSVVGEGESAIVIEPNWPAYSESLHRLGAIPIVLRTSIEEGWAPSVTEVEKAVRPNTKAIILSYPNNPTGKVITLRLFTEVVGLADDLGLTVISDETYSDYSSKPCPSVLKSTPKKFVLTSSFSKTWAMTGFRVGYAVASKEVVSAISGLISTMFTSVPEFIQWGAIRALDANAEARRNASRMRSRVRAACEALDGINSLEYYRPDGAMYLFPRIKSGETGERFAERLLGKGVSVTPGSAFGDYEDFFRISLGQPDETILQGISRIGELLP
jgi:aspartate aminotransferase